VHPKSSLSSILKWALQARVPSRLQLSKVETADTMKLFDTLSNLSALTLHHEKRGRLLQGTLADQLPRRR